MKLTLPFLIALAVVVTLSLLSAQETPAAGDRRGNRCYTGRMWVDCGAAEKPEPQPHITRTWLVSTLEETAWYPATRIDAIDTAGACLYVARTYRTGDAPAPTITAIPKSQLPKGTGCQ